MNKLKKIKYKWNGIYIGIIFQWKKVKNIFLKMIYDIKVFKGFYSISTIRYKLYSNINFLKYKSKIYNPSIFYIKKLLFKLLKTCVDLYYDIILFIKYILIYHWKLSIMCPIIDCLKVF